MSLIAANSVSHSDLTTILKLYVMGNKPVLVTGAPGIGKTDCIIAACKLLGFDYLILHPVTSEPIDYKGLPAIVNGEARFLPYGELLAMLKAKKPLVIFFDDLGQAAEAVQKPLMQLLLAREINGVKISDEVRFVAATNRRKDRAGVSGILEPVKSRFATIVELVPSVPVWMDWAQDNGMPDVLVGYINSHPDALFEPNPTQDLVNSPSPRSWSHAAFAVTSGIPEHLRRTVVGGAVGMQRGTEFVNFWTINEKVIPPLDVLADPEGSDLPDDHSMLYALCRGVNVAVTPKLMANYGKLLSRLLMMQKGEMASMMYHQMSSFDGTDGKRDKTGCHATKAWIDLTTGPVGKMIAKASRI